MLEAAEPAVGADIIAQRRAACLHSLTEQGLDALDERRGLFGRLASLGREGACEPLWRDTCAKQGLAGIDIANPGNQALVDERRFDRRRLALQLRCEPGRREVRAERLDAEALEQFV